VSPTTIFSITSSSIVNSSLRRPRYLSVGIAFLGLGSRRPGASCLSVRLDSLNLETYLYQLSLKQGEALRPSLPCSAVLARSSACAFPAPRSCQNRTRRIGSLALSDSQGRRTHIHRSAARLVSGEPWLYRRHNFSSLFLGSPSLSPTRPAMATAEGKGATTTPATATKATSTTRAANTGGSEYVIEGEREEEEEEEEDTMPGGHGGGWQQLKDEKKGAAAGITRGSGDDDLAIEMQETRSSRATTGTAAALAAGAAAADAGEGGTMPGTTEYRVYKRRWFGLVQLTLLNIIVSWDVSLALVFFFFRFVRPGYWIRETFPQRHINGAPAAPGSGRRDRVPTFYTRRSRRVGWPGFLLVAYAVPIDRATFRAQQR